MLNSLDVDVLNGYDDTGDKQLEGDRLMEGFHLLINGADRDCADTVTGAGSVPSTVAAIVSSSDGDNAALFGNTACHNGTGTDSPSINTTQRQGEDVHALIVSTDEGLSNDYWGGLANEK